MDTKLLPSTPLNFSLKISTMKAPYLPLLLTPILAGCFSSDTQTVTNVSSDTQTVTNVTSISIHWQAPTEDMDNQPLDGIQAYKIFYGHTPGNYHSHITVTDGTKEELTINNIEQGEYYFAMSATSNNGTESELSDEVYAQITTLE